MLSFTHSITHIHRDLFNTPKDTSSLTSGVQRPPLHGSVVLCTVYLSFFQGAPEIERFNSLCLHTPTPHCLSGRKGGRALGIGGGCRSSSDNTHTRDRWRMRNWVSACYLLLFFQKKSTRALSAFSKIECNVCIKYNVNTKFGSNLWCSMFIFCNRWNMGPMHFTDCTGGGTFFYP